MNLQMEQKDENLRRQFNILLKWHHQQQRHQVAAVEQQHRRAQAQAVLSSCQQQQQQPQALFTPQDLTAAVAVAAHVQKMQGAAATRSVLSQPMSAAAPSASMYSLTTPSMTFNQNETPPLYSSMLPLNVAPKRSIGECLTDSAVSESSISNSDAVTCTPSAPFCPDAERLKSPHNDSLYATDGTPPSSVKPPPSACLRPVTASQSAVSSRIHSNENNEREGNTPIPPAPAAPKSLVHQACELYPQSQMIVSSALRVDGEGARRRRSACSTTSQNQKRKRHAHEYPITIALHHNASLDVLQLLMDAAPDVLVQVDGDEQGSALSTALINKCHFPIISLLLQANPDQIRVQDRYRNYPLHASCLYGACLQVVELLTSAYPSVLRKKNFHGMTPLDIAQRNALISDDVIDYLQQTSFGSFEEDAIHMEDNSHVVNEETGTNDDYGFASQHGEYSLLRGETCCGKLLAKDT